MIGVQEDTHPLDNISDESVELVEKQLPDWLRTKAAAAYMHRSVEWIRKRPDIPYLPGKPNHYRRKDLDYWISRNMVMPEVR